MVIVIYGEVNLLKKPSPPTALKAENESLRNQLAVLCYRPSSDMMEQLDRLRSELRTIRECRSTIELSSDTTFKKLIIGPCLDIITNGYRLYATDGLEVRGINEKP